MVRHTGSTLTLDRSDPRIATMTFHNPPVNLIILDVVVRMLEMVEELETDEQVHVLVLKSDMANYFLNHFDLTAAAGFTAWDDTRRARCMDRIGAPALEGALHQHRVHPWTDTRRRQRAGDGPRLALRQP